MVRKPRWAIVFLAVAMSALSAGCAGYQQEPADTSAQDAMRPTVSPSAPRGAAALTRGFATFDELLKTLAGTNDCRQPKRTSVATIAFYLAEGMAPLIAATAICEGGQGAVIGFLKPGAIPSFQRAYQRAVRANPMLWYAESHQLLVGKWVLRVSHPGRLRLAPDRVGSSAL